MTTTKLGSSTPDDVFVRGKSLTKDLIGKVTFTEMAFFEITGTLPTKGQAAVVDACLVTLVEHGLTPSAIATRLVYGSAPEALQGAVAAGLLGVGSVFVGSVEGAAEILSRIVSGEDARAIVKAQKRLPGFGHPQHKPDDPRTPIILAVAEEHGVAGKHVAALRELGKVVDEESGKHITINATGAIAAALLDCGIPYAILRGFTLLSRCAGLIGHVREEQENPAMRVLWEAADHAVPYDQG